MTPFYHRHSLARVNRRGGDRGRRGPRESTCHRRARLRSLRATTSPLQNAAATEISARRLACQVKCALLSRVLEDSRHNPCANWFQNGCAAAVATALKGTTLVPTGSSPERVRIFETIHGASDSPPLRASREICTRPRAANDSRHNPCANWFQSRTGACRRYFAVNRCRLCDDDSEFDCRTYSTAQHAAVPRSSQASKACRARNLARGAVESAVPRSRPSTLDPRVD